MSDALIITSLPPRPSRLVKGRDIGHAYLAQCIHSWRAAGFDVLSINPVTELDAVAALGLPVELNASAGSGLPLISELLAAARASGRRLAGIVNADCHILPVLNLRELLLRRSSGRVLLCERLDCDPKSLRPLVETYGGFDGFFFNPQDLNPLSLTDCDVGFRLGDVWWDFWFPCLAMAEGLEVSRLIQPVLGHLNHAFRWKPEQYSANRQRFVQLLPTLARQAHARPEFSAFAAIMQDVASLDPANFALITRLWLRGSADCREITLNEYPASLGEEYVSLLQNMAQRPGPPSPVDVRPGVKLRLAAGEPGSRLLGAGWSYPEGWGCWIDGPRGEITIGHLSGGAELELELMVRAHVNGHAPEQVVTICANDVPLSVNVLTSDDTKRLRVPLPRRVADGPADPRLTIWVSRPHSPRSANGSADDRQLGVGVETICIHAL